MAETFRIEDLDSHHDRSAFTSGVDALDRYIRNQATQDSRTDKLFLPLATIAKI